MADENAINISSAERWATAFGGGALATYGLIRRSPASLALAALGGYLVYRGANGYCPMYDAIGVNNAATDQDAIRHKLGAVGVKVAHSVSINKPPSELYAFWRNFENLPHFMDHLEAVTTTDTTHSHWVAKAPLGRTVAWDAEIVNERENELIAWRSLPGADVDSAGSVQFRPAAQGRGTEVRVELSYAPPAGKVGMAVAKLFGEEPEGQIDDDLRHFKQLMEAGERPTTEGQPSGRGPDKDQVK